LNPAQSTFPMAKVTLTSLDQKLDSFMELVTKHMDRTSEALDGNGKPGIKTRLELVEAQLKQANEAKKVGWGTIATILATVVAGVLLKVWIG